MCNFVSVCVFLYSWVTVSVILTIVIQFTHFNVLISDCLLLFMCENKWWWWWCVVKSRLLDHLTSNRLVNPHQPACCKHHSTVTALLYIHDYLINATGSHNVSCLCLLSAAFDTTDHILRDGHTDIHGHTDIQTKNSALQNILFPFRRQSSKCRKCMLAGNDTVPISVWRGVGMRSLSSALQFNYCF